MLTRLAPDIDNHGRDTCVGALDRRDVTFRSPVNSPSKIVYVGLNCLEDVEEGDEERPKEPVLFAKYSSSVTGPETTIKWDPTLTSCVDYEVKLALVVGERARRLSLSAAREAIGGYTVASDVSARDLQFADGQGFCGKSLDTFCPLGPAIVTADAIDDPHDPDLNGERRQHSNTGNMIFDIDTIVSVCSYVFTLLPGDIILTGIPPGVGAFSDPPSLLDDGDDVTVGAEGIGELRNTCRHTSS